MQCIAEFPDKLKVRKRITRFWPLEFKLKADYIRADRAFQYGFSCKARRPEQRCVDRDSCICLMH